MAGDWIKMRSNLRRHPKVVRLASALNADRLRVVGGLHAVWCLFDEHSEDGCLCGYTPAAIDDEIGWPGFCGQLMAIGWVESDGSDGLSLPEFDTHNGVSAKRRAQEADRKRAERAAPKDHPHDVGNASASDADKKRTREEKSREEKSSSSVPKGTGGKPPLITNPDEIIFGYGVPLLTAAGSAEKGARSFLGKLRKVHGDKAVIDTLRACIKAKPIQPLEWLAAALPPDAIEAKADPESRSAIEAEGVAKGIGPWNEIAEQWHVYKSRVRGQQLNGLGLDALAAMAAQRSQAGAH